MKVHTALVCCLIVVLGSSCTTQQMSDALSGVLSETLSAEEVAAGLKEALANGATKGSLQAAQEDGYMANTAIKIPFPEDIKRVDTTLRSMKLDPLVDRAVLSINRAAEDAAVKAKPIFLKAITSMTIQDAWSILQGQENAATQYLRKTTSEQLYAAFRPSVEQSLNKVHATRYFGKAVNTYNRIPLVSKVNPDLGDYTTNKAIDGLFTLVQQEEARIRRDPVARTSDLLQRVFAAQN